MAELRVAIAGAGLGGLCLAQGLRRAGIDVTVYERDAALDARRQGYRLHVDARAGLALERCLPPELFELFVATCSEPSTAVTVLSDRLRVLHELRGDPSVDRLAAATLSTSVNRGTVREILAAGLGDRMRFGRELTGFEAHDVGVRLRFADGSESEADLLVGADGVTSAVRRQYLPHAEVVDSGRTVYGKTLLTDEVRALLPPALLTGFTAVVGGRTGLAAGLVRFRERPEAAAASVPGVRLSPVPDYLFWAVNIDDAPVDESDPVALHALARTKTRKWHPDLRALLTAAAVAETFLIRIRTSVPIPAWTPTRVTLLGDAIHAMSPARGSGANTALQDAGLLCRLLTELGEGESVVGAVGEYETRMREYGFAAVEASKQAEAEVAARGNPVVFWFHRRLARK
jgi:2-polyprenyl-6-methoxyphenol hydroxylase-like FAD-dependent oxidoreductase